MVIMRQLPEITVASLITEHPTDGICLISRTAEVPIGMPGGVGGLLSDGESYPDGRHSDQLQASPSCF